MLIDEEILYNFGAVKRQYTTNSILFEENALPVYYYQIVSGKVKMNDMDENGKEFIQYMLSEGQSIGEAFLFLDDPYPASATAIEDCEVLCLTKASFLALLDSYPVLNLRLYQCMAQRLSFKFMMHQNSSSNNPTVILLDYLKSSDSDAKPFSYKIPYTRQQLANLTGLCVETVIRTIKMMEEDDLLRVYKGKILY